MRETLREIVRLSVRHLEMKFVDNKDNDNNEHIRIEAINQHIDRLIWFLKHDDCLVKTLGSDNSIKISKQNFMEINQKWAAEKCADLFAIVLGEKAIGMIALSHQDIVNHTAQIGYWLGSSYWNRGYAGKAFQLVLGLAEEKGMKCVSATVMEDNLASRKIWEKHGAQSVVRGGKYLYAIEFSKNE